MPQRSRAQRLNGLFPLSYVGVVPVSPVNFVMDDRNPTVSDSKNFYIGDLWLNTSTQPPDVADLWMLVSLVGNNATWVNFGAGNLETLTGNTGGPVFPDGADNINVVGDATTITIAGNPGTHTLTASVIGTGVLSTLTGDVGGAVHPLAGNINLLGTAGIIVTTGNPGTHTITWSLDGSIADSYPTDSGTAVPVAHVLNILAQHATLGCGSSVLFSAPGPANTVQLNVTDANGNTIIGLNAGNLTLSGTHNVAVGGGNLHALTTGLANVALGASCLAVATTAQNCTAIGNGSLTSNIDSGQNVAVGSTTLAALLHPDGAGLGQNTVIGVAAMENATSASINVAVGFQCLGNLLTGTKVICVGESSGFNYNGAESYNCIFGNTVGTTGESNVMRLGNDGSVALTTTTKTFISGIRGITTVNNDAIAVLIDSAGQLGTISSSERYKDDIEDMDDYSSALMDLRPVTFTWKNSNNKGMQRGLIAEEVDVTFPDLCIYNEEGKPETVRYHELPVLLLNELQKMAERVTELEDRLARMEERFGRVDVEISEL